MYYDVCAICGRYKKIDHTKRYVGCICVECAKIEQQNLSKSQIDDT